MKKLNLLGTISLFLIFSGLSCTKDEGPEPATVCGMKGDLRKNLRAQVSWSKPYNDWVLEVDNDNNGELDAGPLFNCNGLPEELRQNGIEIIGDIAYRVYETPNSYKYRAEPWEIELKKYKIINMPD